MRRQFTRRGRRGNVIPLVVVGLIALLGMIALAIDIGFIAIARNQCQNAADAAALAGCRTINGDTSNNYNFDSVPKVAIQAAARNEVIGKSLSTNPDENWDPSDPTQKALVHPNDYTFISGQVSVEIGSYTYVYNDSNPDSEGFQLQFPRSNPDEPYSAVRTTVQYTGGYFFAGVFGMSTFDTGAVGIAVHRPRDVVIIMDLSGSMRFQSLPARPYSGARTASMNPESVFPLFGHYSDVAGVALQGTTSVKTGSGEYYDPANLTVQTDSGPVIAEYFFQNAAGELPGPSNRAFSRAPDGYKDIPGGDNYLKKNGNTGSSYGVTLDDIIGGSESNILGFSRDGYDYFLGGSTFQGYTQGPGYWGKTFFIWPPDPRGADSTKNANNAAHHADNGAKDWRQRFFFKHNINASNGSDLGWLDHNNLLWRDSSFTSSHRYRPHAPNHSTGVEQIRENGNTISYNYKINYAAILKWLDTDPKPFPPRLRAGRICYYDGFPNYNDTTLNARWWNTPTNSLTDLNERFWKGYIDFVLGLTWNSAGNYSPTTSSNPTSGTYIQDMIGNGRPFDWGSTQVTSKPDPTPYVTGKVAESGGYAKGFDTTTENIRVGSLSNSNGVVGTYVRFGNDSAIYKVTSASNDFSTGTILIKLDDSLRQPLVNNQPVRFFNMSVNQLRANLQFMNENDNPRRPKHQYWFGPMTLIDYLGNYNMGQYWWPGNVPEAQAWACKVGIQTAIDDIRTNHPNDFVGLTFFSDPKYSRTDPGQHNMAVVPLGRNYQMLKDSLWFPPSTVTGGVKEITPWDPDFDQVPRAKGGTAPGMGFMIAYNLFSSSANNLRFYAEPQPQYRGVAGGLGRRGAGRMIIFETDGAPNTRAVASLGGSGQDTYYRIRVRVPNNLSHSNNVEWPSSGTYSDSDVFNVVKQITRLETDSPPGYSTSRKPVEVHCIGYGTLFDPANASDPDQIQALDFLQTIQYLGNTAKTTDGASFPLEQRIYGTTEQRVNRMRDAFSRIMQGGVQVTLIR